MKNKLGFTLVELLCVIAILSVVTCIASAGIVSLAKNSNNTLYCAKIKIIKSAALDYAYNHELELNNSTSYYENNKSITITVGDLVKSNLLTPDQDNDVINPLDDTSMNNLNITIYLANNRPNIYINTDNVC